MYLKSRRWPFKIYDVSTLSCIKKVIVTLFSICRWIQSQCHCKWGGFSMYTRWWHAFQSSGSKRISCCIDAGQVTSNGKFNPIAFRSFQLWGIGRHVSLRFLPYIRFVLSTRIGKEHVCTGFLCYHVMDVKSSNLWCLCKQDTSSINYLYDTNRLISLIGPCKMWYTISEKVALILCIQSKEQVL